MTEAKTGIRGQYLKAYTEIQNPELDGKNPHFKNEYATLKSTLKAVRDACKPNGIIYRQRLQPSDDGYEMHSSVMNENEEINISVFPVGRSSKAQEFGSNLTYTKRQQAQADWGITGEPDDDGEAASKHPKQQPSANPYDEAKQRCWRAIKAYSAAHDLDPTSASNGIKKRPDYAETAEFYNRVADEFERNLNE